MQRSEQETSRSRGVVQVGGSVHGNVILMTPRSESRSYNDHFAVRRSSVAEVMKKTKQLSTDEYQNLMSFMLRTFETRRFTEISDEERYRVLRYAETLIDKRPASRPIDRTPTAPTKGRVHLSREQRIAYAILGVLTVIVILLGAALLGKLYSR